jgi:hypothetical protein
MNGYLMVRGLTKDCIQAVKQCPTAQEEQLPLHDRQPALLKWRIQQTGGNKNYKRSLGAEIFRLIRETGQG